MKLNFAEKNAKNALEYLLGTAKIKVTKAGIRETFCLHPDFPSLASMSDALTEWQTPNLATRISLDQIKSIPLPALAYLTIDDGILAPIKAVENGTVEWLHTQKGWQTDTLDIFARKWDGVTLLLEPNDQSGEIDYSGKRQKDSIREARIPFLVLGALICLVLLFGTQWQQLLTSGYQFQILIVTKALGTMLCGLLLWQSLDSDHPFIQNLCQLNSGNNCSTILQSKAARVTSWLSWSEIGFIYFSGGFFALLLGLLSDYILVLPWLLILSFFALPYTIYSIWYQQKVAREWCVLCLAVQLLLIIESIIAFSDFPSYTFIIEMKVFGLLGIAFIFPALAWVLLKRPYIDASHLFETQRELQKVKFNEEYIRAAFNNQPNMPPIFDGMDVVRIGNPKASHMLTVVTNLLCGPCAVRHREITNLVDFYPDIQCQFIFTGTPLAMRVASIFLKTADHQQRHIMDSWYNNLGQDIQNWVDKHGDPGMNEKENPILELHDRWCELAGISATPTLFINGLKLSTSYQVKELGVLIKYMPQGMQQDAILN